MAVKRRTIWVSDEDWEEITTWAKIAGETPSVFLREAVRQGDVTIAERLPPITAEARFNSRPFSPAPKTKGRP